ncbi:MAG: hypothetical protein J6D03_09945 [Clostridia bacterium]|nr:hypothetical protein [Clostridia bacterium]
MNSFKTCIGGNASEEVMNIRVSNCEKNALAQSRIAIEKLKIEYANMQNSIENSLDLGMTQTTDLGSNLKDLNIVDLFNDIYDKADKLTILARKIKVRIAIHNTLFPDNKIDDLSKAELDFLNGVI